MKSLIRRIIGKIHGPDSDQHDADQPDQQRKVELENLEPRMLFSAAPVEAPDEGSSEPQAAEESVVVSQQAASLAALSLEGSEMEVDDPDGTLAAEHSLKLAELETALTAQEAELGANGSTDLSAEQNVTLVNVDGISAGLNQATLDAVAEAARQRWIDSGQLSDAQLAAFDNITYEIDHLPAARLGSVDGNTISIDGDAWGKGWFIDATPLDDSEFGTTLASGALSANGGLGGRYDLLTAVLHEQGHLLGLTDLASAGSATGDVMSKAFSTELRLLPASGQAAGATPGSVDGPDFLGVTFTVTTLADSGAGSLRDAIAMANSTAGADFIDFGVGGTGTINTSTQLTVTDDVIINNNNAVGVVINNIGTNNRVFEVQSDAVTFQDLTISGGFLTSTHGAGLYNNNGQVTLTNVVIDNNQTSGSGADRHGGGIWNNGANATLTGTNVDFTNNKADRISGGNAVGGGLWSTNGSTTNLTDVTFTGNEAREGGGFYVSGGFGDTVTLTNATIDNNKTLVRGAGFRNSAVDTVVTINGGTISNNTADQEHGGGFYNNGKVVLNNVDITGNKVLDTNNTNGRADDSYGGGFYNSVASPELPNAGIVEITGGSITGNTAYGHGGGFWNRGGIVTIDGTAGDPVEITGNVAGDNTGAVSDSRSGGGFFNSDGADTTLTWVDFYDGAGTQNKIYSVGGTDADNDLRGVGAGFYNSGQSTVTLDNVSITNHRANTGGGFYQDGIQSQVIGTNVTLKDNTVRVNGGGFRNASTGGIVTLTDSLIDGNVARFENGGGFYNAGTVTLDNTDVSNGLALDLDNVNRRDSHGGGFYNGGGIVNLINGSDVLNNVSYGDGGGFRNASGIVNMTDGIVDGNSIVMFTTATQHGGGFWNSGDAVTNLENVIISNNETGKDTPLGDTGTPGDSAGTRTRGVGGGFWNTDGSVVNITGDSKITDNRSEGGGGFYNTSTGGVVNITGTKANPIEISGNSSRGVGGGFQSTGNTVTNLDWVEVTNNTTDGGRGGGFYNDGGQVIGTNLKINDNKTGFLGRSGDEQGGGFWNSGNGETTLTDSEVNNNFSYVHGGAGYNEGGTITLTRVTAEGNFANNSGGGFFINNSSVLNLTDSSISDNIARDHGGGFWTEDDSKVTALRTNIDGNLAGYEQDGVTRRESGTAGIGSIPTGSDLRGGGFWASGRSIVTLTDSTVNDNETARHGGAGNLENETQLFLDGTTVANNVANNHGGGFRIASSAHLDAVNSTISGNYAGFGRANYGGTATADYDGRVGGGIWSQSGGNRTILNHVTVSDNKVTAGGSGGGAGIYRSSGLVQAENSIIFGNIADAEQLPAGQDASDVRGAITLVNANVLGAHSTSGGGISGNIAGRTSADPGLGALADNGNPVVLPDGDTPQTHSITSGMSADEIAIGSTVAVDQRGMGRASDVGAYELNPVATTLTIDALIVPENAISGAAFDVEVVATAIGGTVSSVDWSIDAPVGGQLATGSGATTSLTATNPATDPVQTVVVTVTVTSSTGQTASATREVFLVDTTAMPATFTAGSIVVDKIGDVVDGDLSAGEVTLREAINAANASGAGSYGITFDASINTMPILASDQAKLNYDGQTVDFAVGEIVTGSNGAFGTVVTDTDNGVNGQLVLSGVTGTFANNNALTGSLGGAAVVNGTMFNNDNFGYDFDILKTNGAVFIVGNGTANTIVSGNSLDTVFDVRPNVTAYFKDLTITGGQTAFTDGNDEHGGGVRNQGSISVFQGTDITGNAAAVNTGAVGGGIYSTSSGINPGRVYMTGGSVANNTSQSSGGGIYLSGTNVGESILHLDGTVIDGNTASFGNTELDSRRGGGVYFTDDGNRLVFNDVTVSDNSTDGRNASDGGGLAFAGADHTIEITGGSIIRNQAGDNLSGTGTSDSDGGGFWSATTRSTFDFTGVDIGGELAGGADAAGLGSARLNGNLAEDEGGGFYLEGRFNTYNLIDTRIIGNVGQDDGGGFMIINDSETVNISQTGADLGVIRNNLSTTSNGGGFRSDGIVNITGTAAIPFEIRYNEARGSVGGGLYTTSNGTTTLTDVVIRNNVARNNGGGYYLSGGGHVILTSSTASTSGTPGSFVSKIIDNKVTNGTSGDGGGFYQTTAYSTSDLNDVLISGNTSVDEGGGFYLSSNFGQVNLTNVDITNNTAADNGGGFYNASNGSIVEMDTVLIDNNTTLTEQGGGFRNNGILDGKKVTITNNTAVNGTSNITGGGFYNGSGRITLVDATIDNNEAGGRGGGFFNTGGGIIEISSSDPNTFRSSISDNKVSISSNDGGGFWNDAAGSTVRLNGVDMKNNIAGDDGGGFWTASDNSRVELTDTILDGNTSQDDGGGFSNASSFSVVTLDDVQIINNVSNTQHGGGFRNVGQVTGQDVVLDNNIAGQADQIANNNNNRVGGAFYSSGTSAIVDLTRVEITNNDSHGRGGGFYNANGQVNLTDFAVSGNTNDTGTSESLGRGGGFWNSSSGDITLNRGEISENESFSGGAGFYQQDNGSTVNATNVTISGNRAGIDQTGGFSNGRVGGGFWGVSGGSEINLNHVTISDNGITSGAGAGAGFRAEGGVRVNLENSIVFGNKSEIDTGTTGISGIDNNAGTLLLSTGANIVDQISGTNPGGFITTDPVLGTLTDNGGVILPSGTAARTHALDPALSTSAIDAAVGSTVTEDQRGLGRAAPNDLGAFETGIALNADELTPISGNVDNVIVLRNVGGNAEVEIDGLVVMNVPLASLSTLTINGQTGDDILTVDYSGTDPLPVNGLTYNGNGNAGGAKTYDDILVIDNGTFDTATHNHTNASDGNVVLEAGAVTRTITYTGLEPVDTTGSTITDFVFNLPAGGDQAQLSDIGSGNLRLESLNASFELTDFAVPTGSITINGGAGDTLAFSTAVNIGSTDFNVTGFDSVALNQALTTGDQIWDDTTVDHTAGTNASGGTITLADTLDTTYNVDGGTVTVTTSILDGAGNSTINLESDTLGTGSTDITVDDFKINPFNPGGTITYNRGGGTLTVNNNLQLGGETAGGGNHKGNLTQLGGAVTVGNDLLFGGVAAGTNEGGTYNLDGGTLDVTNDIIEGASGSPNSDIDAAQFQIDGGTLTVGGDITVQRFAIGQDPGQDGIYIAAAGQAITSTGTTAIGANAVGMLDLTAAGATLNSANAYVGEGTNGNGTVTIDNGNTWTVDQWLRIGNSGTGVVNMNSGTLDVVGTSGNPRGIRLGELAGSNGTLNIGVLGGSGTADPIVNNSGGNFETAVAGTGVVNMYSGTLNVLTNQLIVGQADGSDATFNLFDGLVDIENQLRVGNTGKGVFDQSGGTVNVGTILDIGNAATADGTYTMTGGILNAGDRSANDIKIGNFNDASAVALMEIIGGTVNASRSIRIADTGADSSGTLIVGDGTTNPIVNLNTANTGNFETADNGTGAFTFRSGTITENDNNLITGQGVGSEVTAVIGGFGTAASLDLTGGNGLRDWNTNAGHGIVSVLTNGTVNVGRDINLGNDVDANSGLELTIDGGTVRVGQSAGNGNITYRNNGPQDQINLMDGLLEGNGGTINLNDAPDSAFTFTGGTLQNFANFLNAGLTQNNTDSASDLVLGDAGAGAGATMTIGGNYDLQSGDLSYDFDGANADGLIVNGTVNLSGDFNPNVISDPTATVITLIDNNGTADMTTGQFTGLNDGDTLTIGTSEYRIFYNGADGNDVILVSTAPPTTLYVDDDFTGNLGEFIDGNLEQPGEQTAIIDTSAFTSVEAALAKYAGTPFSGTIVVNGGTYASSIDLTGPGTGNIAIQLVSDTVNGDGAAVTIEELNADALDSIDTSGFAASVALTVEEGTVGAVISGTGSLILDDGGAGNTLTLSGANSYGGDTTVTSGTLSLTNPSGSGTGTGNVTVQTGATLAGNGSSSGAVTVESGGFIAPGGATIIPAGPPALTSASTSNVGGLKLLDDVTTNARGTIAAEDFIGVDVFHWHSTSNSNNVLNPGAVDPGAGSRATLIDGDWALNTGMINPGSAGTLSIAQQASLGAASSAVNGLGVNFIGGLVNGPGVDFVVFEYGNGTTVDDIIINRIDGVVGSLTIPAANYTVTGANLATQLVNSTATTLNNFESGAWTAAGGATQGWAGVGIDLSDLGYAPGAVAPGVLVSDSTTGSGNADFVLIAGLPTPVPNPTVLATGALTLNAGSTYTAEINDSPANDQIAVTGSVTLNNADLDLVVDGTAPSTGNFILIDNDGIADPVIGTFNGLAQDAIISIDVGGTANHLYQISYVGGDGNDVELVALGVQATTDIAIDGSGNLVIKDIDENVPGGGTTGNSADEWTISVDGTEVVINTGGEAVGTLINGATQTSVNEVRVDVSLFTGDVIANSLIDDDFITIGDLGASVLPMGLQVDGGDGFDNILYTGDGSLLQSGGSATFNAEEIEFQFSDLTTTDGAITLNGTGGASSNHQGIHLLTSDLTTGGSGAITLNGSGGDTGNSNQGVFLSNDSNLATTGGGNIDIDGQGGSGIGGRGVMIYSGSSISAGGSGVLTIDGTGGTGGTYQNEGVFFNSDTSASVFDGNMTITGTGSGTLGSGLGVSITDSDLSGTGAGNIIITGTSAATGGFNNGGVKITDTSVDTTAGTGSVTITGSGSTAGTSSNVGVLLSATGITTGTDASITLTGTGTGTTSGNTGVLLSADSDLTVTGAGSLSITGSGSTAGTMNNDGVHLGNDTDLAVENGAMTILGTGGGSGGVSQGVESSGATLTGTGTGSISITGTSGGGGSTNQGILLTNSTVTTAAGSGSITLIGTGSAAGASNNEGIKLANTDLATGADGSIDIDGAGGGATLSTGMNNTGVSLLTGSTAAAGGLGNVTINGTAGGGTSLNRGVYLAGAGITPASVTTVDGNVVINGTAGGTISLNRGIEVFSGTVQSTGSGNVTLTGTGSAAGTIVFNTGVYLVNSTIGDAGTGNVTIGGVGGGGLSFNEGVRIQNTTVDSAGTTLITGTALGATTAAWNSGVYIFLNSMVGTSGTITGTGGGGTYFNHGIYLDTSSANTLATSGTAGSGTGSLPVAP